MSKVAPLARHSETNGGEFVGAHVPRAATDPCKVRVKSSILFASTIVLNSRGIARDGSGV